jgi:hypothetical protein
MSWSRHFDEPIPLPRGRQLITLEDAGRYITRLSKAEHEAAEWVAAMRRGTNAHLFFLIQGVCCGGCVVSWDGRTKIPVVEVIAPDGRKSLWVAAVTMAKAVAVCKRGNSTQLCRHTRKATANDHPEVGSTPARRSAEDHAMTRQVLKENPTAWRAQ